jgi:exopolysaccharide production protein ExoZ
MNILSRLQLYLPQNSAHFAALEALRGLAAFMVVIHHYSNWTLQRVPADTAAGIFIALTKQWGGLGVQLFFVISGYLIPAILTQRPMPYWSYLKRRIRRIYPLALVAISAACLLRLLAGKPVAFDPVTGNAWLEAFFNLLLLPGIFPVERIYEVTWTLSYEMFFYILCPSFLLVLNSIASKPHLRIILLVVVMLLIALLVPSHNVICYFLLGYIAFELAHYSTNKKLSFWMNMLAVTAAPLIVLVYMVNASGWFPCRFTGDTGFVIWLGPLGLAFVCLVCSSTAFKGRLDRFITGPFFSIIGTISYSLYLTHVFAIGIYFAVHDRIADGTTLGNVSFFSGLALVIILSLVFAYLSYLLIERPLSLDGKWPWQARRTS